MAPVHSAMCGGMPTFAPSSADVRVPRYIFPYSFEGCVDGHVIFQIPFSCSAETPASLHHSQAGSRYTLFAINACYLGTGPLHDYGTCKDHFFTEDNSKLYHANQVASAAQLRVLDHAD